MPLCTCKRHTLAGAFKHAVWVHAAQRLASWPRLAEGHTSRASRLYSLCGWVGGVSACVGEWLNGCGEERIHKCK